MPPLTFSSSTDTPSTNPPTTSPLHLRINILQNGKRIHPSFGLPASQCPDIANAKQLLSRKFAGELPGIPSDPDADPNAWNASVGWKFRVWLPEGLSTVENDGDWTLALLAAEKVDWMDGELKVLVDIENS